MTEPPHRSTALRCRRWERSDAVHSARHRRLHDLARQNRPSAIGTSPLGSPEQSSTTHDVRHRALGELSSTARPGVPKQAKRRRNKSQTLPKPQSNSVPDARLEAAVQRSMLSIQVHRTELLQRPVLLATPARRATRALLSSSACADRATRHQQTSPVHASSRAKSGAVPATPDILRLTHRPKRRTPT